MGASVCFRPLTRRSLPKNSRVFDVFVIVKRLKLAFLVECVKSIVFVFDMVDKQNTVGVVDFMLNDASKEAFSLETDFVAVDIKSFDADFGVAWHFAVNASHTKATFVIVHDFTFELYDFGINKWRKGTRGLVFEVASDDNNTLERVNLDSSEGGTNFMRA